MLIFNNHFYYFIVIINIFIGCYYDIQNIRYMRIRYVYDLFKHKSHINAYILFRCYFNGGIMGVLISLVTKILNYIYIPKSEYIFNLFIILFIKEVTKYYDLSLGNPYMLAWYIFIFFFYIVFKKYRIASFDKIN